MKFTANGQSIDFFNFDHSMHDNVSVGFSGGTDSSLLLYMLATYLPEKRIVAHCGTDLSKDPFVGEYATDIWEWMRPKFPNVDMTLELYTFNSSDLEWIQIAQKEIDEAEEKGIRHTLPSVLGHAKAVSTRKIKSELRKKHNITMSCHGITKNPPIEVQEEMGFTHVAEGRRNYNYDVLNPSSDGKNIHVKPFVNVDKRFIAGMYEQLGLMEELFPMTASCIGDNADSMWYTEPCGKCFWCYEKLWSFGCYDGGLKPEDLTKRD